MLAGAMKVVWSADGSRVPIWNDGKWALNCTLLEGCRMQDKIVRNKLKQKIQFSKLILAWCNCLQSVIHSCALIKVRIILRYI